ncbi:MAG: T9SS type A sorting domain-containing protein [Bacteroidota bacterium]
MKIKKILLFVVLLSSLVSHAQVNVTNTGILKVSIGVDTLYVNGAFSNNSGSALTNNGQFYIRQDLTNDEAAMAVGTGTLYLNGTSAQAVNGTQIFKTYNFISNNGSGITLNNDLSVSAVHTFTSGLIHSSATPNYLVYQAGASYTGDADSKHVTGWVKKYGTTNFSFPVGDATYERTAAIKNLSLSSEINCKYYTPTSNIYNLVSPLVKVDQNEYWQINKISGGTAKIELNWDNSKVPFPNVLLSEIVVAHYNGANWIDEGVVGTATGNPLTTGIILSNDVSSFSPFTFGYENFPLPLKLISFTAQRRAGTTYVHWISENEENVSHFEIERSNDGGRYSSIGTVAARNIMSQQLYDFEDHSSIQGVTYYRLKSIDIDGKFSYSKVVAVSERDFQSSSFYVLNPVHNGITIFNKTGIDGTFEYRLINSSGMMVANGKVNMGVNGGAVLPLPAAASAGIYLLELKDEKQSFKQKLLIQK